MNSFGVVIGGHMPRRASAVSWIGAHWLCRLPAPLAERKTLVQSTYLTTTAVRSDTSKPTRLWANPQRRLLSIPDQVKPPAATSFSRTGYESLSNKNWTSRVNDVVKKQESKDSPLAASDFSDDGVVEHTSMQHDIPFFRLKPETGKLVQVRGNIDLNIALARLRSKCSQSQVSLQFRRQRQHERNGLKRKRLRSERWKAAFREGYKNVVLRANQLSKMGW